MDNGTLTIRQMSERHDVTARALRFYEAKGLLSPIRIGQRRLFTHEDNKRLRLILRGKRFGFTLEQIKDLLDLQEQSDNKVVALRLTREAAAKRLEEMKQERVEMDRSIAILSKQISRIDGNLERLKQEQVA